MRDRHRRDHERGVPRGGKIDIGYPPTMGTNLDRVRRPRYATQWCQIGVRAQVEVAVIRKIACALICFSLTSCAFTDNRYVNLEPEHRSCAVDTDCALASLSCSSCGEPVAKRFSIDLQAKAHHICRKYRGPVVDCPPLGVLVCQNNQCALTSTRKKTGS